VLVFTCPFCGLQRLVREERMGKPMRCRGCEEAFTVSRQNSQPEKDGKPKASKTAKSAGAAEDDENEWVAAATEGALPGATAGVLSGILSGALTGGDVGTAVSWAMVGLVAGIVIGTVLGGAAGVYTHRLHRDRTWQRWPAPILLGALVGLATAAVASGHVQALPVGALAGLAGAALWPLLGKLTQAPAHVSANLLDDARQERSRTLADDTRHYIDPSELNQAEEFAKRRQAR